MFVQRIIALFASVSLATAAAASNNVQGREDKQTLNGFIQSTSEPPRTDGLFTDLGALFFDNDAAYQFQGSYDTPTAFWSVVEGVVSFDKISQLAGAWDFFGQIGPKNVTLTLEADGFGPAVSFSGPLENPLASPVRVSGNGTWERQQAGM